MSYYKEIDGIKYDKAILDIADEQIKGRGDGRLSEDDMKLIIKAVIDRKKITKTEYLTIFYLIKNYNITEKAYNGYMINRSLSYFPDTVLAANEMNVNHQLDKKMQFDFLINIIRKRKRFSKWEKKKADGDVDVVKEYYGYNDLKAVSIQFRING